MIDYWGTLGKRTLSTSVANDLPNTTDSNKMLTLGISSPHSSGWWYYS